MEISNITEECIKIRGKTTTILIDPVHLTVKTPADAILLLKNEYEKFAKVEGHRIVISGPGEYQVGDIKISAVEVGEGNVYNATVDNVAILIGTDVTLSKMQDKIKQGNVALVRADAVIQPSLVPTLECMMMVLYGPKAEESAKAIGKTVAPVSKVAITLDKLPTETEVIVLG